MRPAVSVTAPPTSGLARLGRGASAGTRASTSPASTAPSGTLRKNTHCQPGPWTSRPPKIDPAIAAVPPAAPKMPSARLRSGPSANVRERMASAFGAASAAPRPWPARAAIRTPSVPDKPPASDAAASTPIPATSTLR